MYEAQTAALGCPCKEFPPMKNPAPILAAYREARKQAGAPSRQGVLQRLFSKAQTPAKDVLPVLIAAGEDSPLEGLSWPENGTPEERRSRMLAEPILDGKAMLERLAARHREDYAEDGFEWPDPEILGEMKGGGAVNRFLGISDYQGGTIPLVLAELPVKNPWEVFAWVPFGGWNECPGDEEQMAAAKYWYGKYGAVPAVITRDVLEYDLPAPVPRSEAMALALEQYAFCPDIVDQGCGTIGLLADILSKSTEWYFWWD